MITQISPLEDVFQSFVQVENLYHASMLNVVQNFILPLRSLGLFSDDEICELFEPYLTLCEAHSFFCENLNKCQQCPVSLGVLFHTFTILFDSQTGNANMLAHSLIKNGQLFLVNSAYTAYVKSAQSAVGGQSLDDCLLQPITRVSLYFSFLEFILEMVNNPDFSQKESL